MPIQTNGSRVPLFCIHAIGGDVLFYQPLSNALGPDQPFYAFQSPLVAAEIRETTLEELASIYVKELRAFYPNGPYLLLGASLGGHIVFEMARQLSAQGAEPRLLMLIDAGVPGSDERLKTRSKIHALVKKMQKESFDLLEANSLGKRRNTGASCWLYRIRTARMCRLQIRVAAAFHFASTIFRQNKLTYAPCDGIASNPIQEKSSSSGQRIAVRFSADTNTPRWAGATSPPVASRSMTSPARTWPCSLSPMFAVLPRS